jgi:beta-glucosidase
MSDRPSRGAAAGARSFPPGFIWGAATAAYQIEGAAATDGRGPSVWDTFSHTPGKVAHGDTGDVACDFYHRWREDLDLLVGLSLDSLRFSVSWSRVQPLGHGAINQPGLDFYRALVAGMRERDITPAITLHHWDLPQALQDDGGWANRDTAERFAEFAQIVAEAIGDAGGLWMTLNEPQQVVHQGYREGTHAPGLKDDALAAASTHHLLLAHGLALAVLREALPAGTSVGVALDFHPVHAIDKRAQGAATIVDAEKNRIFLDPVLHGHYPSAAREHVLPPASLIKPGDMDLIRAPIDFLGINYYNPHYITYSEAAAGEPGSGGCPGAVDYEPPDLPRTSMGWLIEPSGLYDTLVAINNETPDGVLLYVTENGCANDDVLAADGTVQDTARIDFLYGHIEAAHNALASGVPLAGYFVWSLLDNFEWAHGYDARFGIVYVDYETQERTPKASAGFYRQVAQSGALPREPPTHTARP